jgi:DNA-binding FrmR family transcriptional regulator
MKHETTKNDAVINFKKARSLIEKIITMIEEDEYCIDIMTQNLAVIGLLKSAHQTLMENHLNHCFSSAMESKQKSKKAEMIGEILRVTKLVNK